MEISNGKRGGRVMLAQLLLNIFIAFLWMLLIDEDHINASTFFAGFLVGIGIIFLMLFSLLTLQEEGLRRRQSSCWGSVI